MAASLKNIYIYFLPLAASRWDFYIFFLPLAASPYYKYHCTGPSACWSDIISWGSWIYE